MEKVEKQPYFVSKPDPDYSILQQPIGVDTSTSHLVTRIIDASQSGAQGTLAAPLTGKDITFDFSVSPTSLLKWNDCGMEFNFGVGVAGGGAVSLAKAYIQWNALLTFFEEVRILINGVQVYYKSQGEYAPCQTFRWLTEYTNEGLENNSAVFSPVGDENYTVGLADCVLPPSAVKRNERWIPTGLATTIYTKMCSFKDLFFDFPGLSENIRTIKIALKTKANIPMANVNHEADAKGLFFPTMFRLHLEEYVKTPTQSVDNLASAVAQKDEHLSFIDVSTQSKVIASNITIPSQKNVQWVGATQFCHETLVGNANVSYQDAGHFLMLNGYPSNPAAVTKDNVIESSDKGTNVVNGNSDLPANIQCQIGGLMYPYSPIELKGKGAASDLKILQHHDLYMNYCRAVKKFGHSYFAPAISENIFKKTMPFFICKPIPNTKQMSTGDIVLRISGSTAPSGKEMRIMLGQLVSYTITAKGTVTEFNSSY
jgi:hypothetical protein